MPDSVRHAGTTCVVHLVRAANGLAPLERFLAGWRRNPPGVDCTLVLALKGFAGEQEAAAHLHLADEFDPAALFFSDAGLDLGVYFETARRLGNRRYCFLNSFSEPLVDGWLNKLEAGFRGAGVGLVAATGSWASLRSWTLYCLGAPTAYSSVLPGRRVARRHLAALGLEQSAALAGEDGGSVAAPPSGRELARARLASLAQIPEQIVGYEPFPAEHLRTNAMMVDGSTLEQLGLPSVETKREAYLLESGRRSLTRRVQSLGLRTLVVDRNGLGHEPAEWIRSGTFWRTEQEGLLVADNQTRAYQQADPERRRVLSGFAWGR